MIDMPNELTADFQSNIKENILRTLIDQYSNAIKISQGKSWLVNFK